MNTYEHRLITVNSGSEAHAYQLNDLGKEGFRLVGVIPLFTYAYFADGSDQRLVPSGSQLIFERENISEENI